MENDNNGISNGPALTHAEHCLAIATELTPIHGFHHHQTGVCTPQHQKMSMTERDTTTSITAVEKD